MIAPVWVEVVGWVVALSWAYKFGEATVGMPKVADLLEAQFDQVPRGEPSIVVVVPARNEAAKVAACLRSLMAQDYGKLTVVAVDDRSTDATGALMDGLAAEHPGRLRVLHVTELPADWLGKTHAMAMAAEETSSDWLLFTDGDVLFRVDAVRRSLAYAMASGADHLVVVPTTIREGWDEGMMLGFFQTFGMWAARPWKIPDPKAKRDAIGIGAFNMMRRSAYEGVGGFEALRMEVVEDIGMGRRVKRMGFAQRIAFGRGLASVHWAPGALGLVNVMTKNIFSAFRFYVSLLLVACGWLVVFCVLPVFGLLVPGLRMPALITLVAIAGVYRLYGKTSGISAWQAALSPVAASLFVYALLRSMVTTLRQGGVIWRGTFYPLKTLRKYAAPLR
ncbi:glycosyltransferase [Granulicella arctica]|uniref:glycosyltransferase n=1 Tax=Granulicella arctica TaxID=940613 RepID=UPI0021E0C2CC|nr:glycosyltransferase [Granulicella arctica]